MQPLTDFGKFIKNFCMNNNENLANMSKKIGISRQTLYNICCGKSGIKLEIVDKIVEVYALSKEQEYELLDVAYKTVKYSNKG